MTEKSLQVRYHSLQRAVLDSARTIYGDRLVSLVVFGSAGRGVPQPGSDLDLLIVCDTLPRGRVARADEFRTVEASLVPVLASMRRSGLAVELSPVFKTPDEVRVGSPLFLDMIEDARFLYDRDGFMRGVLLRLKSRLEALGARRIRRGNAWFWDLKRDYRIGEVFEL
jgi:uncharacterized protein